MKRLHKDQRGFSIIELLVVIVLTALITTAVTTTFFQVFNINARTANHMSALSQVQQAGKEVSKDTLQAQTVNATGSQGFPLTLTWVEWGTNQTNSVNYTLEDVPSGLKELQRSHSINSTEPTVIRVAQYIDPYQTSCSWNNVTRMLTFTVTATVGNGPYEAIETRIYEIEPRPGS